MPHGGPHFGTQVTAPIQEGFRNQQEEEAKQKEIEDRRSCIARGGKWDPLTKTCDLDLKLAPPKEAPPKPPKVTPGGPELFKDPETGKVTGVTLPDGRSFFGLNTDEINDIINRDREEKARQAALPGVGTAQARSDIRFRGQQLAGQIGEFGELPISPTGFDIGEAATTGIVASIPSALRLGVTGAGIGLVGGAAVGAVGGPIGAGAGAAIGAAAGFVSGIASGMIGNFKSQRADTTTAQQRTLDEGKQTMMDWVTLARADPVNRNFYLTQFNQQAAQIDQAFRQMKLDTSRDLAKFETALPNLAEFHTFYSVGGERDSLNEEMRNALIAPLPEGYDFFALAERRKDESKS